MTKTQRNAYKMLTSVFILFFLTWRTNVIAQELNINASQTPTEAGVGSDNGGLVTTESGGLLGVSTSGSDSSSSVSGTGGGQGSEGKVPEGTTGGGSLGGSNNNSVISQTLPSPSHMPGSQQPNTTDPSGNTIGNNILPDSNNIGAVTTQSSQVNVVSDGTEKTPDVKSNGKGPKNGTSYTQDTWAPVPLEDLVERNEIFVLYQMTTGFLAMIQPNDINSIKDLFDFNDLQNLAKNLADNIPELMEYMLGYSICLSIGLLLAVFVPIVGIFVCCCRCCGNCGGKVDPKDRKSSECTRCCCGFLLFTFLAIVLSGGVIMVFLSLDIESKLTGEESVFDDVSNGFTNIARYGNQTLDEIRSATLEKYQSANEEAFSHLEAILPEVTRQLDAETHLNDLASFTGSLQTMSDTLQNISRAKIEYGTIKQTADSEINGIKGNVNVILSTCTAPTCDEAQSAIDGLKTNGVMDIIDVDPIKMILDQAISLGLDGEVNDAKRLYEEEMNKVNSTVEAELDQAKDMSDDVEESISSFIDELNDALNLEQISNIAADVDEVKREGIDGNVPYLKIPGWAFLGFAILTLVIVFCYYLGLSCGTLCKRPKAHKSECCTWKTGACWLLTGIALTFILYFMLMLVLIVVFFTGGVFHTELCRHLYNLPNSPVAGMVDEAVQAIVKDNFTLNISETYVDCAHNKSLYTAFKLEENGVNLTEIINTESINKTIDGIKEIDIEIGHLDLFTPEHEDNITTLGREMDMFLHELVKWMEVAQANVTSEPITEVANKLREAAPDTTDADGLIREAEKLENMTSIQEMEEQKETLQFLINQMDALVTKVNLTLTFSYILERIDFINENGTIIVGGIVNNTADKVQVLIIGTVKEIDTDVKEDIGRCGPVYTSMSTIVNSVCVSLLYSVNAYWFCMGMVLIPLIFVMACSFKLVGLYRKTSPHSSLDAIDNNLYMTAYNNEQDHRARDNTKKDQEMLLKPISRGRSDYLAMADNPVFQDDELPYAIPRAVLRTGRPVLPVHPAAPNDEYYYAMPRSRSPPPKYTTSSTGF